MRLPLLVVSRLAAHNLLATHGMTVPVLEGSEAGAPADAADVPDLLTCLFAAQQRRVDKFRDFRRAFDVLLADGNMGAYNTSCAQVAAAFAEISKEVNELGTSLRNAGRADLFEAVRSLQQHEKEQLRLEATLQVLRKEHAAQKWSWQRPDGAAAASIEGVAPRDVRPAWASNCRAHVGGATDGGAPDGEPVAAGCQCAGGEPTEEEFNGALAEATQALQAAVVAVNDALGELREAAHELQEEQ